MTDAVLTVIETEPAPLAFTVPGVQGPPGPRGPAGDAPELTAATTLSGHRVIAADESGLAVYADQSDDSAIRLAGLSLNATSAGATVPLLRAGPIAWPAANLTPGLQVYLSTLGGVTQSPPTSGWLRQVGVALATDILHIDIGPAYWLGA